jgi:hypothetical protein
MEKNIVFVSGHYPEDTYFARVTRKSVEKYTNLHGYGFYYNEDEPESTETHVLHFYRCVILEKASTKFPEAKWFIWLDSDIYITNYHMKIEDHINLQDENILYHLFHEKYWGGYPINTGVKIVNRKALYFEEEVWGLRNTPPYNEFPFEQKTIYEYVVPKIPDQYIIHDPYVLNCYTKAYPECIKDALYIHMCGHTVHERNQIIQNNLHKIGFPIIVYFHICQRGQWKRSLQMSLDKIVKSGLYDVVNVIRCGVVNDSGILIPDEIFNDPKMKIIYEGLSHEYERPTLLHMRNSAEKDAEEMGYDTKYLYLHTKGIRWFGADQEQNVVDWIKLLQYWNIEKWRNALIQLEKYDTYGCNYINESYPPHYSGNFFWTKASYVKTLDNHIGDQYNDPEFWLLTKTSQVFNAFESGFEGMEHYHNVFPEELYREPEMTEDEKTKN